MGAVRARGRCYETACILPEDLSFRKSRKVLERKRDRKRKNSHPVEGLRLPHPGPIHGGDRSNRKAHHGGYRGTDSAAYDEKQILCAAVAACRQEVTRAV